ncbi:proteasome regulatory particle lid subunit [Saccharomycopsis crataegensis]|uniref:Proteasome regulatory particle lid subunit n=1 Tax=Saccharomycopsis crataegensis TaxID=43959 RepID=A0AAV5QJB0_9ASCO|nr:proteasome regulatory particle lid subunit [Saccharomycopsis crataegensis]
MNNLSSLQRMLGPGGFGGAPMTDGPISDNKETIYISSLALLKMLKHGTAGVPMEVMGLMLGEFVDEYTVHVIDVFAMPQSGTGVSVEAVDSVFQTKMMDMLRQTGRDEKVVGWYHSHPGFGCWLSSVDVNTQQSFEQLNPRSVAVVIDPIQSVRGKVVIDAFRLISSASVMMGQEPRQTTSNIGHLNKPSIQALIHGLNRNYYSLNIDYKKTDLEVNMLLNLHKQNWSSGLILNDYEKKDEKNLQDMDNMVKIAKLYSERIKEEKELTEEQLKTRYVGKQDPKKHLGQTSDKRIEDNIVSILTGQVNHAVIQ